MAAKAVVPALAEVAVMQQLLVLVVQIQVDTPTTLTEAEAEKEATAADIQIHSAVIMQAVIIAVKLQVRQKLIMMVQEAFQ